MDIDRITELEADNAKLDNEYEGRLEKYRLLEREAVALYLALDDMIEQHCRDERGEMNTYELSANRNAVSLMIKGQISLTRAAVERMLNQSQKSQNESEVIL